MEIRKCVWYIVIGGIEMNNREKLESFLQENNCIIGCYDTIIDTLTDKKIKDLFNVITSSDFEDTRNTFYINRKKYILELCFVEIDGIQEVDFEFLTLQEFKNRNGS